jgi:hypothetical protein
MPLGETQEGGSDDQNTPEARDAKASDVPPSRCLDKVLLIVVSLLVCVIGGAAFWLADEYHFNPLWVFAAWNSILLVPILIKDFRLHLKKPSFVVYLVAWAFIHGLLVAALMRWFSVPAMLPFLAVEIIAGLVAADYFFDIQPRGWPG